MPKDQILVGVEIGTSKICAVVAGVKPDGNLIILGVGEAASRGIRKAEIVDFANARICLQEALTDAESRTDVTIEEVTIGVSGAHIASINNRGSVLLPDDNVEIEEQDILEVEESALQVNLPEDFTILHVFNQHYSVDGMEKVSAPKGMSGRKLDGDFHIIYGMETRISTVVRSLKELTIEHDQIVFNGIASAFAVLDESQKKMGVLVIDIGGGTTEYVVYVDGEIRLSGVLAVGGDHLTNDLSMGLRIPTQRAERLKINEGSVILGNSFPGETIVLKQDSSFAGREIEREQLNTILNARMEETFELLRDILERNGCLQYLGGGAILTGGGSRLQGLDHLIGQILQIPVRTGHARDVSGNTAIFEKPEYSAAIGLVKYAYMMSTQMQGGSIIDAVKDAWGSFMDRFKFH